MRCNERAPRAAGFTAIELIVVVAIVGVIASLAAPSFARLLSAQRIRAASYDLMNDLTLARSEALKRSNTVLLTAPAGESWRDGWAVTVDGTVLARRGALRSGISLTVGSADGVAMEGAEFRASGRAASATQFELQDNYGRQRCIKLDLSGRPSAIATACRS